jgi:hypothetical protein
MSTAFGTGHEVPWPLFIGDGASAERQARERALKQGSFYVRNALVAAVAAALAADDLPTLTQALVMVSARAQAFAIEVDAQAVRDGIKL